jgi:hypothetical protein
VEVYGTQRGVLGAQQRSCRLVRVDPAGRTIRAAPSAEPQFCATSMGCGRGQNNPTCLATLFVVCAVGAVTSGAVKIVDGDSIHELAAHGEVKGVLRILEADPSQLNKRGLQQRTPLMHSVLSGQTAVVKALLEAGADANIPEKVLPVSASRPAVW